MVHASDHTDQNRQQKHSLGERYLRRYCDCAGLHPDLYGLCTDRRTSAGLRPLWFPAADPPVWFPDHLPTVCRGCRCHARCDRGQPAGADGDCGRIRRSASCGSRDHPACITLVFPALPVKSRPDRQIYLRPCHGRFYLRGRSHHHPDAGAETLRRNPRYR